MMQRLGWFILFIATIAFSAIGEEPIIKVQVSADEVYVGDAFQLFIEIESKDGPVEPTSPHFDPTSAIRIDGPSIARASQQQTTFVNGRTERVSYHSLTFEYRITPERAGIVTIPASTIFIDGQSYRTNPIDISVIEAPIVDFATLELVPDRTAVYVGQPVRMRLRSTSTRIYSRGQLVSPPLPDSLRIVPVQPDPALSSGRLSALPIFDTTLQTVISVNEATRSVAFEAVFDLVPERVGSFSVGPLTFQISVAQGRINERYSVQADAVEIAVLPLPTEGQPDNFDGHVGDFQLMTQVDSVEARLGDPITLQLTIQNGSSTDQVEPPDLEWQEPFTQSFKLSPEGWTRVGTSRNGQIFSTVIRPRIMAVEEIPPVELAYFDPVASVYKIARSKPIPLKVIATREITAADAVGQSGLPSIRETLAPGGVGPRANRLSGDRLRIDGFDVNASVRSPLMLATIVGPPLLWLATAGTLLVVRRRDPVAHRRRSALARATRAIRRSEGDRAACADALRGYISDTLGVPRVSVTSADVARCAGDRSPEAQAILREGIGEHEASTFGGKALTRADKATLIDALGTLDRARVKEQTCA